MKILTCIVIVVCALGLWITRPSNLIIPCEKVNTLEMCQILDKE